MKSFKSFLLEYLSDEQRQRYANIQMTDKARSDTDHFFGVGNDKVVQDLDDDHLIHSDKSEVHRAVERHLGVEIDPTDYNKGMIPHPRNPKNITKIGKLISDSRLRDDFNADNTRAGSKAVKKMSVSIVRGTEVAGQTNSSPDSLHPTGHSWGGQSCKNIDTGSNNHYLEKEIRHGSVVMFGHDHDGKEIYRATLQPHHNQAGKVAYAIDSEYGIKHPAFTAHANKIAGQLSAPIDSSDTLYNKHEDVYDDNNIRMILHPNATAEHISKALEDKDADIRRFVIKHPKATADHISKALEDEDVVVRKAAIRHPNATADHITKALEDTSPTIRSSAISHPKATAEHISKALEDTSSTIRLNAISHPNATAKHISKALQDKYGDIRQAAISHPNATAKHISKALQDKYGDIRQAAISHPNATAKHISKALEDEDVVVRMNAIDHPNVTTEHISKALRDKDRYVRQRAQERLNSLPK